MAADLVTSAEQINNPNAPSSRRPQHQTTESLLADFDSAYSQLQFDLATLHRSFTKQQQMSQRNQCTNLLKSNQQQMQLPADQNPVSLVETLDRMNELLKPPTTLQSSSGVESLQQKQQQMNDKMDVDEARQLNSAASERSKDSKQSSDGSARQSPNDEMGLMSTPALFDNSQVETSSSQTPGQATQRKLLDIGYGDSDSESHDDAPSSQSAMGNAAVAAAAAIVNETSLSMAPNDDVKTPAQPSSNIPPPQNEDSMDFGNMFTPSTAEQQPARQVKEEIGDQFGPSADSSMMSPAMLSKPFESPQG